MKTLRAGLLLAFLLTSCGKEEASPAEAEAKKTAAVANPKPPTEKKPAPVAPQGKLPQMEPEKAKFIAVPSTPKDKEETQVKKVEGKTPTPVPPPEIKKPGPAVPAAITAEPEVKKAEVK